MASRTPQHHRVSLYIVRPTNVGAFGLNNTRDSTYMPKIIESVGRKLFLFFVNFLYGGQNCFFRLSFQQTYR